MGPMLKRLATRLTRKLCTLIPWLDGPRIRHVQTAYEKAGIPNALLAIPDGTRDEILKHLDTIAPLAKAHA